jgi:hypothetical protein
MSAIRAAVAASARPIDIKEPRSVASATSVPAKPRTMPEGRPPLRCALGEQAYRLAARERRHAVGVLAGDAEGLAAGGQQRAVGRQAFGEARGGLDEVLAVVEDDEQALVLGRALEAVGGVLARVVADAEDLCDGAWDQRRTGDGMGKGNSSPRRPGRSRSAA